MRPTDHIREQLRAFTAGERKNDYRDWARGAVAVGPVMHEARRGGGHANYCRYAIECFPESKRQQFLALRR
jgi:hypothetical protein